MTAMMHHSATLSRAALGQLMPLHVLLDGDGTIIGHGPTLEKLLEDQSLLGRSLFDAFELRRPAGITGMAELASRAGEKLRLNLRIGARVIGFRGIVLNLDRGGGLLINLSFGIGVAEAVRNYSLTDGDFAPTDLAIEMMYLVEARAAAMGALRGLAQRLDADKQMAEAQAMTDTLTGLRNRRALSQVIDTLVRNQVHFGLMHVDLDFFKTVNDTLGHAAGDHVLRTVAVALQTETRAEDTVARVGGDEFVLVFPAITDAAQLEAVARRIIDALTRPMDFEGQACNISASIGIALSTQYDTPDPDQMQSDADEALYASKRGGRGQARVHGAA